MSHYERVVFPTGGSYAYYIGENQTWQEVVEETILPNWIDFCNDHWISENSKDPFSAEERVKYFLDRCAYLIMMRNPDGIETTYKTKMRKIREIAVSDLPAFVESAVYSASNPNRKQDIKKILGYRDEKLQIKIKPKAKPKEHKVTRFSKINKIRELYPNSTRKWVHVLTDNTFEYDGNTYKIPDSVKQYQPRQTKEGVLYDMDKVLVVDNNGEIVLYDQNADLIDC